MGCQTWASSGQAWHDQKVLYQVLLLSTHFSSQLTAQPLK
jgi:hypothetical protein